MGFRFAVGVEPLAVDVHRMLAMFRSGVENLCGVWGSVWDPADIGRLRELARRPDAEVSACPTTSGSGSCTTWRPAITTGSSIVST